MLNMLQKTLLENLKCVEVQSSKLQRDIDRQTDRQTDRGGQDHPWKMMSPLTIEMIEEHLSSSGCFSNV
jgi:hypothetical protein